MHSWKLALVGILSVAPFTISHPNPILDSRSIPQQSTGTTAPPFPDVLPHSRTAGVLSSDGNTPAASIPHDSKSVRAGAWMINLDPAGSSSEAYDGTIRVEAISDGRRASGDLYERSTGNPPLPQDGIPIQPIRSYSYYVRVTQILDAPTTENSFKLGLQLFKFTATTNGAGTWAPSKDSINATAIMSWVPAPEGFPSPNDYLEGDLKQDGTDVVLGHLKMGWLSQFFRKATVEIDTVAGSEQPLDNGDGQNWQTFGESVGFDLKIELSERDVSAPSGESWADSEMNDAMIVHREKINLDSEWHYHILTVHLIDSTPRGVMYDSGSTDSDHVPREGVGISSHWVIPEGWGTVSGMRFGLAKAAHFRTAIHELGHALGLQHNTVDMGIMNTSDVIAENGTVAIPFPSNIKWAFADNDLKRLRHWPDIFIRPGGVPFGSTSDTSPPLTSEDGAIAPDNADLKLELTPLLTEVPLGAPVRVGIKITNTGNSKIMIPARIDLKSAHTYGVVKDASGTERGFRSIIGCLDEELLTELKPKESVTRSLTLLRGGDGALFPAAGTFDIGVTLHWVLPTATHAGALPNYIVQSATKVVITEANNSDHAKAAQKVLTTPDAHLVLALGGDYLASGVEAVDVAVGDKVLGPHWCVIKAKTLAKSGKLDYGKLVLEGKEKCIMSTDEKEKLESLLK